MPKCPLGWAVRRLVSMIRGGAAVAADLEEPQTCRTAVIKSFRVVGCRADPVTVPLARPPGPYIYTSPLLSRTYSFAAMSNVPDHRLADRGGYRGHVGLQLLVCAEPAVVRLGRD